MKIMLSKIIFHSMETVANLDFVRKWEKLLKKGYFCI